MALDPQDTEGLEDETVAAWTAAETVMITAMAAGAMRAARRTGVPVRVAAQHEWSRTVGPRVTATASGLVADTPRMVEAATEQAAIRGAEAAAQEAATVRPAAPRHRATLPGSGTRTSAGSPNLGSSGAGAGRTPRSPRPMTLPRTRPQVPGNTTPPPVRPGRAAAEATGRALDKAARQVPQNAKNAWDRIINDAVNRTVAGELTIEQAMQQAMDQAAKEGIGFYRDSAGRKWGLDTYSEMAIRTGTNQALRDAHAAELLAQGIDLVIVSSHANPAPVCAPYEQKVLSLTGEHPNGRQTIDGQSVTVTASIAEAEANGLHHPNCRHTHTAYLPGFTEPLPVADDPDHAGYKATQRQRYYEREIRRSQRMEAAATTPEAKAKAAARRRAYEAKLATHRKQWDLPRRRHRELLRGPSSGAAAAGRPRTPTPEPTPVASARGGGGAKPPAPPRTPPQPLMSGGGDDDRWRTQQQAVGPSAPRPALDSTARRHILDGEPGKAHLGGHRRGVGRVGKTEFPASWSDADIINAVDLALSDPHWSRIDGDRSTLRRVVTKNGDRVLIEASYYPKDGEMFLRAGYPKSGDDVVLNLAGGGTAAVVFDDSPLREEG
ncbi:phage minor capsid protein [Corynebacterium kalidii]